ncbi:hypothetical protein [Exiguobacterium profundum]
MNSKRLLSASLALGIVASGLISPSTSAKAESDDVTTMWCAYLDSYTKANKTFVSERFVRALTPWAKASSYQWTDTTTATAEMSGTISTSIKSVTAEVGVAYQTSKSYSVSQTIPVPIPTKDNRLVLRNDMYRYDVTRTYGDPCIAPSKVQKSTLYSPTSTHYLRIQYL